MARAGDPSPRLATTTAGPGVERFHTACGPPNTPRPARRVRRYRTVAAAIVSAARARENPNQITAAPALPEMTALRECAGHEEGSHSTFRSAELRLERSGRVRGVSDCRRV